MLLRLGGLSPNLLLLIEHDHTTPQLFKSKYFANTLSNFGPLWTHACDSLTAGPVYHTLSPGLEGFMKYFAT